MRWHVHGTDVTTGQRVTLAIDETEATHAVQAALSKRIIVSHVTREWLRRMLFPMACAAVVVLAPVCVGLYWYQDGMQSKLRGALREQSRLTEELVESEGAVRDMKAAGVSLVNARALASANERAQGAEKLLAEARSQLAANRDVSARLEATEMALASVRQHASALEQQTKEGMQNVAGAAEAQFETRKAELERANQALSGEVETLKSQLLVAAAKSEPVVEPKVEEERAEPAMGATRWALRPGYDAAADFVTLHFEKESMQTQPGADGTAVMSAVSSANASTVRVLHDRAKQRVYSATLTVSLAADGPKDKVAENMALVVQFVKAFAPGMKDVEGRTTRAVGELAAKDASERTVLVGEDVKVSVWNDRGGMYTWRVESLGNELGG